MTACVCVCVCVCMCVCGCVGVGGCGVYGTCIDQAGLCTPGLQWPVMSSPHGTRREQGK